MRLLIVDNYDSFTHNLVQIVEESGLCTHKLVFNDAVDASYAAGFDKILFSPGPGLPSDAGCMKEMISMWAGKKPMLGVCLGHQAMAEVFGGQLIQLKGILHGEATSSNIVTPDYLFEDIPSPFMAGRYHSWVINPEDLPDAIEVLALSADEHIMALRHREYDMRGLQFHPESIMTPMGSRMICNFLRK